MEKLRFSVIIPTLNEEKFLPKLLASLAKQTKRNFEVIVVDGRSRDRTVAVAKTFRLKLPSLSVEVSPKASLPLQRNLGALKAQADWLVFVDADSVLLPYFIERTASFIDEAHPKLFTTWFRPDSEVTGDALIALLSNIAIESSLLFKRPIAPGPLTVVTRAAFNEIGGYDEEHRFGEDVDFGRRLAEGGVPLKILRETLFVWSLRRFRAEGTLRVIQKFAIAVISVLVTKRTPKYMPGYIMGGTLYNQKKPLKRSLLRRYEGKLRKLMKEFFE